MVTDDYKYSVCIKCMTFNHAHCIQDALNGFSCQMTGFPYVAVIVDDASTDGNQNVILDFFKKHFDTQEDGISWSKEDDIARYYYARHKENRNCFYSILLLKRNLFRNPLKRRLIKEWEDASKFIALCEGDDYWTDSLKLQKQVDILENHPDVTLCCTACQIQADDSLETQHRYDRDCIVPTEDIIIGGGLWLHTVTILHRSYLLEDYPDYCRSCHVGDYPLLLWASLNGSVYYLLENTAVYRYQNTGSWTLRRESLGIDPLIQGWESEVKMLQGLDDYSGGKYSATFKTRIRTYLYDAVVNHPQNVRQIVSEFREEVKLFTLRQKVHVLCIQMHIEPVYSFLWNRWLSKKRRSHC